MKEKKFFLSNVLWSRNAHRRQARKDRDIYRFRFIAVASRGYKS